jgi:hypothetical protein
VNRGRGFNFAGQLLGQQIGESTQNRDHQVDGPAFPEARHGLPVRSRTSNGGFLNRVRRFESYRGHQKSS